MIDVPWSEDAWSARTGQVMMKGTCLFNPFQGFTDGLAIMARGTSDGTDGSRGSRGGIAKTQYSCSFITGQGNHMCRGLEEEV